MLSHRNGVWSWFVRARLFRRNGRLFVAAISTLSFLRNWRKNEEAFLPFLCNFMKEIVLIRKLQIKAKYFLQSANIFKMWNILLIWWKCRGQRFSLPIFSQLNFKLHYFCRRAPCGCHIASRNVIFDDRFCQAIFFHENISFQWWMGAKSHVNEIRFETGKL